MRGRIGGRARRCQRFLGGTASPSGAVTAYASAPIYVPAPLRGSIVNRIRRRTASLAATAVLAAAAAHAQPPVAQPVTVRHSADEKFAGVEHEYVTYVLGQFPVVATYLGGSAFDASLAGIDGRLRDYAPAALQKEDARLAEFRTRFVALAEIGFLLHEHEVRRHQLRSLDSYVDEPFRGVDWQIQGMTATGTSTYGTDAEWQGVIARTGVEAHATPDWRVLRDFGLQSTTADADYFSKSLPQLAATDLPPARREALVHE